MPTGAQLADATTQWLDSLDATQADRATLPFDDGDGGERRTWTYLPGERHGLPLSAMDRRSDKLAHRLLAAMLSESAFVRAQLIMALDEVLDQREGFGSDRRARGDYWVAVFGRPGPEPWGLRFEGHHLSVQVTVAGGEVAAVPLFLGANPARAHHHGRIVSAPLAAEEDLGFELLGALTVEQRSSAVVADRAPDDIQSAHRPRLDGVDTGGVPLAALDGAAARTAETLVGLYLDRVPSGAHRPDPDGATFAWAGASEPGTGHYYRVAGPRLLIELDNTQDGANHVHSVLRDPGGDFGSDLLAAHYQQDH